MVRHSLLVLMVSQCDWQGQSGPGEPTRVMLDGRVPWNLMDRRPFWLRQPGFVMSTEMPQPSEQASSLQNCAQPNNISVSFAGRARAMGPPQAAAMMATMVFFVRYILRSVMLRILVLLLR